jgi:hypothetical protein
MLIRQPGLTLVATFALAIGIPVGLLPLHVLDSLSRPLPVKDGERIVMVRNYDTAASSHITRPLHDFLRWREELSSFENLAMWRTDLYNVVAEDEAATRRRRSRRRGGRRRAFRMSSESRFESAAFRTR